MLQLMMAGDYVELQRSENHHQADSHAEDGSKRLKYNQMVAIREAVITAPQLSAMQVVTPSSARRDSSSSCGIKCRTCTA